MRLSDRGLVRNRYVRQVLLATFGFGLLLALVAVLQTPGALSLLGGDGSSKPAELRQGHAGTEPPQTTGTTHRAEDFKDDCDLPAKWIDDCPQPEPQKICQRTQAGHEKSKTLVN